MIDFFFQKRSTRNDLKMTKQEVRQESKNNDGDPLIKVEGVNCKQSYLETERLQQLPIQRS